MAIFNPINLFGRWHGVIIYGSEYEEMEGEALYFTMDIKQDKDEFSGTAIDIKGAGMTPGGATVKGFISGNDISFVKQYNSTFNYDEEGNEIFMENVPGPEIFYTGTYDPFTKSIEGDWEIHTQLHLVEEGVLEDVATGTWSMQRK